MNDQSNLNLNERLFKNNHLALSIAISLA